jgi:SAM-dependent methyltransferase
MPPKKPCIVCQTALCYFGPKNEYHFYRCPECGTLQLFPMPDEKGLAAAYANLYATAGQTREINDPDYWKSAGYAYRKDIFQTIDDHEIKGLVIDFGAGWGHLCELLIKNRHDCRGVEISSAMAAYAGNKGLPVVQGSFEVLHKFSDINAIVMCAVFEHLTNHRDCLRRFYNLLPEGGHVITLHPTAACYTLAGNLIRLGRKDRQLPELHGSFCPPWHTALFSLKAMEILASDTGFKLTDIRPASQGNVGGPTGIIQQALGFVNRAGFRIMGNHWPLITSHVFVLKKH